MELREALARVVPFAGNEGAWEWIELVPHGFDPAVEIHLLNGEYPLPTSVGYVAASNGRNGVAVALSPRADVPAVALRAVEVRKALTVLPPGEVNVLTQGATAALVTGNADAKGVVHLAASGAVRHINLGEQLPTMRAVPETHVCVAQAVAHCAVPHADLDRAHLQYVHLTPLVAEATDQYRVARAACPGLVDHPVLVDPQVFRKWRNTAGLGTSVGQAGNVWFMQLGEELRWTHGLPADQYVDLRELWSPGPEYEAVTFGPDLRFAAAQAAKTSSVDVAALTVGAGVCGVMGLDAAGDPTSTGRCLAGANTSEVVRVVLRASYLHEALVGALMGRAVPVALRYSSPEAPITVVCGGYAERIWPLFDPEQVGHGAQP